MSVSIRRYCVDSNTSILMGRESAVVLRRCQETWDALFKATAANLDWKTEPVKINAGSGKFRKQD